MLERVRLNGIAAYFGLLDIGQPKAGETVVVSAAAGATGSIAGQIAKIKGCRVVGIAGSDEKCAWVVDELGLRRVHQPPHRRLRRTRLRRRAPNRVDVYFDNVGGPILDAVLGGLDMHGRVVLCGAISVYNDEGPAGPGQLPQPHHRPGRMEGFITLDYWDRFDEIIEELRAADEGRLVNREEVARRPRARARGPQHALHRRQHRQGRGPGRVASRLEG